VTRWRQAHNHLTESDEWRSDPELRKLPTLDILLAFEDYSRVREREYEEQLRRTQVEKTRKERKAREAFKVSYFALYKKGLFRAQCKQTLLHELVQSGVLKARTKWKDVYPLFREDPRYLDILGNPGSNPLELFWDAVDVLDQQLDEKVGIVENILAKHNAKIAESEPPFSVAPETTWEEFVGVINADVDAQVKALDNKELRVVFTTVSSFA